MEKRIDELEQLIFFKKLRRTIILSVIFFISSILACVILYKSDYIDNKQIIGLSIGFIIVVGYMNFDIYTKKKEMRLGIKIVEDTIVTSFENNLLTPFFTLDNKLKLYADVFKRSNLNRGKIKVGTKIIISYLPNCKYIISVEVK